MSAHVFIDDESAISYTTSRDLTGRGASGSKRATTGIPWVMEGVRSGSELASVEDPAWPELAARFARTKNARIIPISRDAGLKVLNRLQVTARSMLGALALNCGGVILDYGWLRILGGGGEGLWSLADANQPEGPVPGRPSPGSLVVALDVLGGIFAINGETSHARLGEWSCPASAADSCIAYWRRRPISPRRRRCSTYW